MYGNQNRSDAVPVQPLPVHVDSEAPPLAEAGQGQAADGLPTLQVPDLEPTRCRYCGGEVTLRRTWRVCESCYAAYCDGRKDAQAGSVKFWGVKQMKKKANTLYPGRPNYTGPQVGIFGLLHHGELFESSHNVNERVAYVRNNKAPAERSIRLHCMCYLEPIGGPLSTAHEEAKATAWKAYEEAKAPAWKAYEEATATAWKAYEEAMAPASAIMWKAIKKLVKDAPWNGKELVFKAK